jgi:hypothetical protein
MGDTDAPTPRDAREDGADYGDHADRAEAIGLLADNLGAPQAATADFEAVGYDYDHVGELAVWSGETVDVYEYEPHDADTRWAACWSVRPAIDDVRWHSLIFADEPGAEDVETAAEIVNVAGTEA